MLQNQQIYANTAFAFRAVYDKSFGQLLFIPVTRKVKDMWGSSKSM